MSEHRTPSRSYRPGQPLLARIIATIGPASDAPHMVEKLIGEGVNVFRLNFSHGSFEDHYQRLDTIRAAARKTGRTIAVLGDLQGPKIRVGKVPDGGLMLEQGMRVIFRRGLDVARLETNTRTGNPRAILPTTYPQLIDEVEPGQRVLINDGFIRMLALGDAPTESNELHCRVVVGGLVTTGKGINLPESDVKAPAITEKDWECVEWAVQHRLDFLALSFVRKADEITELKQRLATMTPRPRNDNVPREHESSPTAIPVIAKIEKPQALANIYDIVQAADAIMVARGDLGVEMDIARVPIAQKQIIAECAYWGKPCIVATQMLESMIESATPTRAEASDVANAIFDGADAVMLSGETAVGKHPDLVVDTMARIVGTAEARISEMPHEPSPPGALVETKYSTAALAHGAWHVARDIGAVAVICWSQHGGTARYLSQNDFRLPIVAYSSDVRSRRRMALLKGVTPIQAEPPPSGRLADWNAQIDRDLLERGLAREGDVVLLLAGKPLGRVKSTNTIAVSIVGDPDSGFRVHDPAPRARE